MLLWGIWFIIILFSHTHAHTEIHTDRATKANVLFSSYFKNAAFLTHTKAPTAHTHTHL